MCKYCKEIKTMVYKEENHVQNKMPRVRNVLSVLADVVSADRIPRLDATLKTLVINVR